MKYDEAKNNFFIHLTLGADGAKPHHGAGTRPSADIAISHQHRYWGNGGTSHLARQCQHELAICLTGTWLKKNCVQATAPVFYVRERYLGGSPPHCLWAQAPRNRTVKRVLNELKAVKATQEKPEIKEFHQMMGQLDGFVSKMDKGVEMMINSKEAGFCTLLKLMKWDLLSMQQSITSSQAFGL